MTARIKTRGPTLLTWQDRKRSRRGYSEIVKPPTEQQWHIDLVRAIKRHSLLSPGWRMTHFPSGGERTGRSGSIMQAMGLERGWPDLLFARPIIHPAPVALLHGLELKRLGEEPTEEQAEVGAWFQANGWPWAWTDRIEGAWAILWAWGAIRMRVTS